MDTLLHDIRYAARKLLRTPAFTTVATLTLALGIGATTAVYSVVDAVVVRPLGFANPSQLVRVGMTDHDGHVDAASPLDLRDFAQQSHVLAGLVPMKEAGSVSLQRAGLETLHLVWSRVGANFFSLLGVGAEKGRVFADGEDKDGSPKIAVLSDATWRTYFNADPSIVGHTIRLNDVAYTVVGVLPASMTFPGTPNIWVPYVYQHWEIKNDSARGVHEIFALGRLKPGVTLKAARADLQAIASRLAQTYPLTNLGYGASVESLKAQIIDTARAPLLAMLGAVALVLLIACANVANLLLVRAASRQSEIAVRTALGAARSRVIRQLIIESVLLSLAGFAFGALLATWTIDAVVAFGPRGLPRLSEIAINGRVLLLTGSVALATGVLFGLVPALHVARPNTSAMLREGGRGVSRSGLARTRSVLVIGELALAVVLLVGAGLLLRGFARLVHADPGFQRTRVLAFDVSLNDVTYPHDAQVNAFANALSERLQHLPGTEAVGMADANPFESRRGFDVTTSFTVEGRPPDPPGHERQTEWLPVSAGYFKALGVPLLRGRVFNADEDLRDTPPVMLINQTFARRYFPGEDPIGKHLTLGISHDTGAGPLVTAEGEIVGVVGDVRDQSLADSVGPCTYSPFSSGPFHLAVILRSTAAPPTVMRATQAAIRELDPDVPVFDFRSLDRAISASVSQERFYTLLLGAFATIALVLAALGIYGVISYVVSQRTSELGIRIALGAAPDRVLRHVLGGGMSLTLIGLALGLLGAVGFTRAISTLLFGVPPLDPLTYAGVICGLTAVALLACWIPARRAARLDPVIAMRAE